MAYVSTSGVENPTYLKEPMDKYMVTAFATAVMGGVCCIGYGLSVLAFK